MWCQYILIVSKVIMWIWLGCTVLQLPPGTEIVDNLFVFVLIFKYFKVPRHIRYGWICLLKILIGFILVVPVLIIYFLPHWYVEQGALLWYCWCGAIMILLGTETRQVNDYWFTCSFTSFNYWDLSLVFCLMTCSVLILQGDFLLQHIEIEIDMLLVSL